MSDRNATCANCGRAVHRPDRGQYPPAVKWVHAVSPLGIGNRYCDMGGATACVTPACTCKANPNAPVLGHLSICPVIVAQWRTRATSPGGDQ